MKDLEAAGMPRFRKQSPKVPCRIRQDFDSDTMKSGLFLNGSGLALPDF